MRHRVAGRKLGRNQGQRRALFSSLTSSLIIHEQIKTTLPKAKDLRPLVERLITKAKKGTLAARREIIATLEGSSLHQKLMDVLAPRYADRHGGYTRIIKAGFRQGDNAPMAIIEFVERDVSAKGTVTQDKGKVLTSEENAISTTRV
ncbi:MAG: 50S ribosomal protein L17 [Holosporales bacterium]|jgi:large subunit ribosomal protein L17